VSDILTLHYRFGSPLVVQSMPDVGRYILLTLASNRNASKWSARVLPIAAARMQENVSMELGNESQWTDI
jgi:hypothetical protein